MADYCEADVPSQIGKTAFITGANTGIGYDTARVLAERGAKVLLGCRTEGKALEAINRIKGKAPDAELKWIELDLADLSSIKEAVCVSSSKRILSSESVASSHSNKPLDPGNFVENSLKKTSPTVSASES